MKKLLTFCALVLGITFFTAMRVAAPGEFKFVEETHDFGKIAQGTPVTYEFKFTNIGEEPIIISNVQAQCGCTVPKYSSTPVKKGEVGTINVTYNAASPGAFTKTLTITSNAKTPTKVIYIKGEVVEKKSSK